MEEKYDFVIIGSGLGGLECAYILSKQGHSVCVLEKNRQFGGCLQIFARDKVIFDTGVHYIGGLDPGQNLHSYFSYFGLMDNINYRKMDVDGFDRISFGDNQKEYKHAMGHERFKEELVWSFPNEKEGIQKYIDKIHEICAHFPLYNLQVMNSGVDISYLNVSAKSFIESCTSNVRLQNVLAGSNALYAGYGDKTPLYVHALVINTYIESSYRCVDGGGQITRQFEKSLKSMGCKLINYAKVTAINVEDKKVTSVSLEDGRKIVGKNYISNIHPKQTMQLIEADKIRKTYRNRLLNLDNSISVFTVHAVLKKDSFPYLNYNYYHHSQNEVWDSVYYDKKNWPENFAAFVPADSASEEYASSMNIMSYMKYEELKPWADSFHTVPKYRNERDPSYQDWKLEKAEKILDLVETKFPNFRSHIKNYYTSTPLSFRDYIGTTDGSLYGVLKDYKDPLNTYISPKTKIANLFLTGQNLNMHGMLGVTIGAVVTCSQFIGMEELLKQIKRAS